MCEKRFDEEDKKLAYWKLKVSRLITPNQEYSELLGEVYLCWVESSKRFNPNLGTTWKTYWPNCVRFYFLTLMNFDNGVVRVPINAYQGGKGTRTYAKSIDTPVDSEEDGNTLGDFLAAPEAEETAEDVEALVSMVKRYRDSQKEGSVKRKVTEDMLKMAAFGEKASPEDRTEREMSYRVRKDLKALARERGFLL